MEKKSGRSSLLAAAAAAVALAADKAARKAGNLSNIGIHPPVPLAG